MSTKGIPSKGRGKANRHELVINGYPVALVQKVRLGRRTLEFSEAYFHPSAPPDYEVSGQSYEPLVLTALEPLNGEGQLFFEDWMNEILDPETGSAGNLEAVRRDITVYLLGDNNKRVAGWDFIGCQAKEDEPGEFDRASKDDLLKEVTINYQFRRKRVV